MQWMLRGRDSTRDPRVHSVIENIASAGSFEREIIELSIGDIVGHTWTCPAVGELLETDVPEG